MRRPTLAARLAAAAAALALLAAGARADEGLWTFEHVPVELVRERHGLTLTPQWLQHLQTAAVDFGASASFVSERGLMLTNHHVAIDCIQQLSGPGRDLVAQGYVARRAEEELRCPGATAQVLVSSEDVTAAIRAAAGQGGDDAERNARRKAERARLETACGAATGLRCTVVALYSGAVYQLYRYRQWDDVRLVFAPEVQAANFGGDPDNFVYPRFALDMALLRVYEQGRPVRPPAHLTLARQPLAEGDLVFAAGQPGGTQRLLTLSQIEALREVRLPLQLDYAEGQHRLLKAYGARSPEAARQTFDRLDGIENWLKSMRGEYAALREPGLQARKAADEARFRAAYAARGLAGDPWRDIETATRRHSARLHEIATVGYGRGTMFGMAGRLVELAYERQRPEGQRLAAYRDNAIASVERGIGAPLPFYRDFEVALLTGQLQDALRLLGAAHPYVRAALGADTPAAASERLVRGSRMDSAPERQRLLQGGIAAIEAADDALVRLAREVYPLRRELVRFEEEQVSTPLQRAAEALGQARFALYGHSQPPDATGTLRLSFGKVAGYESAGMAMPWKTTWGGWLARADSFDGRAPFDLPARLAQRRDAVDPRTPLNFVSTIDSVGGNSGSPVVNRRGEWVGLLFDGNLEGLGGPLAYDEARGRSIAVHADAILAALEKLYDAPALAAELRAQPASVK